MMKVARNGHAIMKATTSKDIAGNRCFLTATFDLSNVCILLVSLSTSALRLCTALETSWETSTPPCGFVLERETCSRGMYPFASP